MEGCVFCGGIEKDRVLFETTQWIAMYDKYPVSKGHVLLIPKRHVKTIFGLTREEQESIMPMASMICGILDEKFKPNGYNIGVNCYEAAGQTVMHCHIHIIPRYDGDVEDPRGGVRGVIPSKQKY